MSSSWFPHRCVAFATGLACTLLGSLAHAQSWRLHGTGAGAHAVSGHQKDELGFGAAGLAAVEYAFVPEFAVGLELGGVFMAEGDRPSDPGLEPIEGASAVSGALALRVRPFATRYDGTATSAAGFWIGGGIGAATTNSLNRLFLDAHLGYDFLMHQGKFGVGPTAGLLYVNQPNDRVRPADANILVFGVHVMFDFAEPAEKAASDRDRDGLVDEVDKCPDNPEDMDGFEDSDGCPEDDNDKDGILDLQDGCPLVPEDKDGFEDGDGCPDGDDDRDKDGIVDPKDKCPDDPEDRDGFEDEDGCPDDDNDKDGIPDAKDLCPDEAETPNGYADEDGCPDEQQVRVVGDKIVLDDRVHFRTNNHTIRKVSYPLLERLSKLVSEHPEYTHIAIEGHADLRGEAKFNKELSQRRAESVLEFMVEHGVARDRLSAEGFGSERPLVNDKTEHAYLLNRRVEFVVTRKMRQILGPDGQPIEPTPKDPMHTPPATPPEATPDDAPPDTSPGSGEGASDPSLDEPAAPEGGTTGERE